MEAYRSQRARRLAPLTAVLMSIAVMSQPNPTGAADSENGGTTALSGIRGPRLGRSDLSQMPGGDSVVLRGTRPSGSNASQPSGDPGEGYAGRRDTSRQMPNNPYDQRSNNTSSKDRYTVRGGMHDTISAVSAALGFRSHSSALGG